MVVRRSEAALACQPGKLLVHDCEGGDRFDGAHAPAYAVRASCAHSAPYPVVRDATGGLVPLRREAAAGVALMGACLAMVDVLADLRAGAKAGACDDSALHDLLRCVERPLALQHDTALDARCVRACVCMCARTCAFVCVCVSCSLLTVDAHALLGLGKRAVIEQGSTVDMMLVRRPRRCAGAALSLRSVLASVSTDALVALFKVPPPLRPALCPPCGSAVAGGAS